MPASQRPWADFGNSILEVQTGSELLDQLQPYYLSVAAPFTMCLPVGGYDVRGKPRWRRPETAAPVQLADLVRGLPRRMESQFRRHWSFVPMLWNLYFRERVNLGQSLALKNRSSAGCPLDVPEEDAACAAARCYQRLHEGTYLAPDGKRRRIAGDTSKLLYADGATRKDRELLRTWALSAKAPVT